MNACQRWLNGRHSFRPASEGGFDPSRYDVAEIRDDTTPRAFVERHHYSGSFPAVVHRYGLFERGELVGVAVLGVPAQKAVLTGPFPTLQPYVESLELSRFVLLDRVPANAESWFWARCRELAAKAGLRGILAFSDPVERIGSDGQVVKPGHVGTIYQASNALYLGRGTARTLLVLPDATVLNERTLSKIRRQERGHEYGERLLVRHGAPPRHPGQAAAEWLPGALRAAGVRRLAHPGNFRYAWRLGREARAIALGMPVLTPYPKKGGPC